MLSASLTCIPLSMACRKFVGELARVCAPDGTVLVVTWCCREGQLDAQELALLDRICEAYYLPAWISIAEYKELFGEGAMGRGMGVDMPKMKKAKM